MTQGIFQKLKQRQTTPWNNDIENVELLDLEYFGNHSGDKYTSPLIDKILTGDVLTDENINNLVDLIYLKYKTNWERLYNILKLEYDPIENYSMVENSTDNKTFTDNNTFTHGHKIDNTVNSEGSTNADIYGFNTSNGVPSDKSTATSEGTSSETHSGNDVTAKNGTDNTTHELSRSGNIGVTTSQQMIESEIALWQWNFFEQVYKDIDKILTISIY